MTVALLSIGTELVRGEIHNSNATWLCEELTARGLSVREQVTVPDSVEQIAEVLLRLSRDNELILSTGGLGPTSDDVTAQAAAKAMAVPLKRHPGEEAKLRQLLLERQRPINESSLSQTDLPDGCAVIDNDWGTAPGFEVTLGAAQAYFFPGVPREMKPMFHTVVKRFAPSGDAFYQVRLRTFGLGEPQINEALTSIESRFNLTVGYRAHFPEVEVKLLAHRSTQLEAERSARAAADEVRSILGSAVFGEGSRSLTQVVGELLRAKEWSLGLAESCTGGEVSRLFTQHACSDYYRGGIVSYANDVKQRLLAVDPQILAENGAVSEVVARQMARGAQKSLGAHVTLALTGIAGPTGGTADKPVGLVHYAVATPDRLLSRHQVFRGDRNRVQLLAAFSGIFLIREALSTG